MKRVNKIELSGQFQDCDAYTDTTVKLYPHHIWKEHGKWFEGKLVMDGCNFIRVRVEHDYFENNPVLFEQLSDRVIEGVIHTEISRGTGVVSYWVEVIRCEISK